MKQQLATLNDLKPGESGIVIDINALGGIRQRLMDMGIIEGAKIVMIGSAPLDDPVQIKVLNTIIALRRKEASTINIDFNGEKHREQKRHRRGAGGKS